MADKIYVGSGKEKTFSGGGSIISVSLDLGELIKQFDHHGFVAKSGKKMIKIDVGTRRSVGEYGDTHSVSLNTWHPDSYVAPGLAKTEPFKIEDGDDIPF